MLKKDLILQAIDWTDHYRKKKLKKGFKFGLMKDELSRKSMK